MKMEDLWLVNNTFPTFNEVIKDIRTIYHMQVDKRIEEQLKSLLYDFKKKDKESIKNRS